MKPSLLVIEDEPVLGRNICTYLGREGYNVSFAASAEEGLKRFEEMPSRVVLVDYQLPGMNGLEVLAALRSRAPEVRVVVMTGNGDEDTILRAFRLGAADYLKKPLKLSELGAIVAAQAGLNEPKAPVKLGIPGLVGNSPEIERLRKLVQRMADTTVQSGNAALPSVLITGETGTGKELIARELHAAGGAGDAPFVEINCAAIPQGMIESELFGHEPGAYTDARERRTGLIESAARGTIFLDEVASLDLASQAKLLRVLEDRRLRRLGGVQTVDVKARFVAATSANLEQMIAQGAFRADLFYRLSMLRIEVPSLRERAGDVPLIAAHFLNLFGSRYAKPGLRLSSQAQALIDNHDWPGNVRELRNVIEQAVITGEGTEIPAQDLKLYSIHRAALDTVPPIESPVTPLEVAERDLLQRALKESGSNVSKASRILGVSRDTLRYRIRKHGLV